MIIHDAARAPGRISVVDLHHAGSPELRQREAVAEAIGIACREMGFFYVGNHGVPDEVMRAQLDASARFFAQPMQAKLLLDKNRSPVMRGYERLAMQTLDEGAPPDLKESFMVGRDLEPDHWLLRGDVPFEGPNLWPEDLAGFREQLQLYTQHMITLGQTLAASLCLSLGLPEDHLGSGIDEPNCSVRMLRYPPRPPDAQQNQLGAGAHTDWGFLTILLQDAVGGLEVQTVAGDWIRAEPIPGTFIVNLGDMVPRLTNGRYTSNPHRVLNNTSGRDRYSVATFFNPHGLFDFEVAPTCLVPGETPPPSCSYADHIQQMYARTFKETTS